MNTRKFECTWDDGYVNEGTETHSFDWFTLDLGYEQDDIDEIADLEIGDTYIISGPMGVAVHKVYRTK
jgi:hypothetical protein